MTHHFFKWSASLRQGAVALSPFIFASGLSLGACGTSPETPESDDSSPPDGEGGDTMMGDFRSPSGVECAADSRLGSFTIDLAADYTSVRGAVTSGVVPSGVPEVLAEEAGCQLLGVPPLFCDPGCGSGQTCGAGGVCITAPTKISAGILSVSGLAQEISQAANGITGDYSQTFKSPYPGFDPGAQISLQTSGDVAPGFLLHGIGVELMSSPHESFPVESGAPSKILWDAPSVESDDVHVHVSLTVNAHGATTGWIECTGPDTGELSIPGELVSGLVELGLSGFPRVTITRRSVDSVAVDDGCIELAVSSELMVSVEVPGLVSCSSKEDCPAEQICQPELVCGE